MRSISKIVYIIKMILFVLHFYFVFLMLHNILDTGLFGIIFIVIYLLFVLKTVIELLSKKDRYKNDIIYNVMNIGVYLYLLVVSIKTYISKIYVTRMSLSYFKTNYIILSILIIFIFVYNYLEFKSSKK